MIPDPLPSGYFQPIVPRLAKAKWIKRAYESDTDFQLDFTDHGHKRMKRHAEIIQQFYARTERRKRTFFGRVMHDVSLTVMEFRIFFASLELQPPRLTGEDIGILIANARLYALRHSPK